MRSWSWGLLSGVSLLAGCEKAARAPLAPPALDQAVPAVVETATFALG